MTAMTLSIQPPSLLGPASSSLPAPEALQGEEGGAEATYAAANRLLCNISLLLDDGYCLRDTGGSLLETLDEVTRAILEGRLITLPDWMLKMIKELNEDQGSGPQGPAGS